MEMLVIAVIALGAFTAVLLPLFRRRPSDTFSDDMTAPRPPEPRPTATESAPAPDDELEAEVLRYRAALRDRTLCRKCGQANPAGSRFCYECGAPLPLEDAKEFE